MTLILTASALEAVADMPSTIKAVEQAFHDIAVGTARQPGPISMQLPPSDSCFVVMPGLAAAQEMAAVKLLADIPANQNAGLPTQRSIILLTDLHSGAPLAVLDGRVPTRVRTAAASAVASKHLARPGSSTLGLVGAGALAVAHAEAMVSVLPIDTIVVWSRTSGTVEAFRRAVAHLEVKVIAASAPREAVEGHDVVCTLTPSVEPIVSGNWFMPGQHINAVGARPRPTHREIDSAGMARACVFVDSMDTAAQKSGDLLLAVAEEVMGLDDVRAELGDVIAGRRPGRQNEDEVTLFDSVGVGMQDLAIGRLMYDAALARNLGLSIDLGM